MQTSATVTDYTTGVAHSFLPQPGTVNSLGTAVAGAIVERELGQTLPRMGVYSAQNIAQNDVIGCREGQCLQGCISETQIRRRQAAHG